MRSERPTRDGIGLSVDGVYGSTGVLGFFFSTGFSAGVLGSGFGSAYGSIGASFGVAGAFFGTGAFGAGVLGAGVGAGGPAGCAFTTVATRQSTSAILWIMSGS